MSSIVLASRNPEEFAAFAEALLQRDDVNVTHFLSGEELLTYATESPLDVVVLGEELTDSSGLQFSHTFMKNHPLINCAIVSTLSADEFHEATEGLGIFMQLPPLPKESEAVKMLELLESIHALMR